MKQIIRSLEIQIESLENQILKDTIRLDDLRIKLFKIKIKQNE